jgi:hypothetical protein
MRERNGIKLNSFSDFIRTPYRKMPRIIGKCRIFLDDKLVTQARRSWIQDQLATPPELWMLTNMFWMSYADMTITYEQMKQDQEVVMKDIERLLGWKRKPQRIITDTVGWHPPDNKAFEVSIEDQQFLDGFNQLFVDYQERCSYDTI